MYMEFTLKSFYQIVVKDRSAYQTQHVADNI